jgi:CubicO group peptidase (beta-lactamase class C family)
LIWRRSHYLNALCALSLLSACAEDKDDPALSASDASATAGDGGGSTSDGGLDFKSFDDALQNAITSYNATEGGQKLPILGASAVVVHKDLGAVHSKGFGQFAADRLYLIASSSKILSVCVLKRLEDQGKVDFSAPISKYLGTTWGDHKANVSLAQLFSNSSGLPSLGEILALSSNPTPELLAQYNAHLCQYAAAGTLSDCGKSIYQDDQPANNRAPDQTFRYGGSQWQLAGAVAEVVSGKTWADLIKETYVTPCGVPSIGYTNPYGQAGVSPLGYPSFDANQAKLPVSNNPSIEGGGYATAPDYAKLLLMHLRGGKCGDTTVLSAAAVATMQKDRVAAYGGTPSTGAAATGTSIFTGYGLGWWVSEQMIADPGAYGAFPFLDVKRGYGAIIMLEVSSTVGGQIGVAIKPSLDAIFDKLKK